MKPTLTWDADGICTNPPPVCAGLPDGAVWSVWVTCGPGWVWCAELSWGDPTYAKWVGEKHHQEGFATAEAAQLACEVALWRLGVLQLPEWSFCSEEAGPTHMLTVGDFAAEVVASRVHPLAGLGRITRNGTVIVALASGVGPLTLKSRSETVLRALIAAALEGGA